MHASSRSLTHRNQKYSLRINYQSEVLPPYKLLSLFTFLTTFGYSICLSFANMVHHHSLPKLSTAGGRRRPPSTGGVPTATSAYSFLPHRRLHLLLEGSFKRTLQVSSLCIYNPVQHVVVVITHENNSCTVPQLLHHPRTW
jgi:hypothetical protein